LSYASIIVTPGWMRLVWFGFGLVFSVDGIRLLLGGESGWGAAQLALGVGWVLLALFKSRRRLTRTLAGKAR
jgi:hypothetical protein